MFLCSSERYQPESSNGARILECGGGPRRHLRGKCSGDTALGTPLNRWQSGVVLRFPPHSIEFLAARQRRDTRLLTSRLAGTLAPPEVQLYHYQMIQFYREFESLVHLNRDPLEETKKQAG